MNGRLRDAKNKPNLSKFSHIVHRLDKAPQTVDLRDQFFGQKSGLDKLRRYGLTTPS
jgi:hypothetical protein